MNIRNKKLDITIYHPSYEGLEVDGKCVAATDYKARKHSAVGPLVFTVKKKSFRQVGKNTNNLNRYWGHSGYGPVLYRTSTEVISLGLFSVEVIKINGKRIEDYFGLSLEKWPLSALQLRFYRELQRIKKRYAWQPGGEVLQPFPTTSKEFIRQLRFARDLFSRVEKIYQDKTTKSTPSGFLKICDIF